MSIQEVGAVYPFHADYYEWIISSFSVLSEKEGSRIWSPLFAGTDIYSSLLTKRLKKEKQNFLAIRFSSIDRREPRIKCIKLGITVTANSEVKCCNAEWVENGSHFRVQEFFSLELFKGISPYKNNKSGFRLFCEVVSSHASSRTDTICSVRDAATTTEDIYIKSNDKLNEENCSDLKSPEKLVQNLKDLFLEGKHSDILFKVKDREFKVHKAILVARSSVFDRMFSHDFSESNTNVIPIGDCKPSVFEEFLYFLYTGRTRHLSSENVCGMYYLADKYDIPELKEECVDFLNKFLTVETICDVICLSIKHNEVELLKNATVFFAKNLEEILVTVKWQTFLSENPTEANELYIKAMKLGFTKKSL